MLGQDTNSPRNNPQGPSSGAGRVLRGGSWINYAQSCRSAFRDYNIPAYRRDNFGFRLAVSQ
ncbi:MAG: SUMF1/EgtB/PvdO family nonheme iron enzyme [Chitinophagales bacterium]|nr:SUMF1/EgtB/PvdO family nonheme iron enzyme [Chitinophagales bacterium]